MKIPFREERADWAKVLEVMYRNQITVDPDEFENPETPLHKPMNDGTRKILTVSANAKMKMGDSWDAIDYLIEMGLVEEVGESPASTFGLTQEGLQLGHQIKSERQRRNTNIILSGGIILVSVLIFLAQILPMLLQ